MGMKPVRIEVLDTAKSIPPEAWKMLTGGNNPFVERGFFLALEQGGCLGASAGWIPRYLAALDDQGTWLGLVPLFVKTDSYGEYIFDWAWAQGAQRAGLRYYPKGTVAVPFTPATGPRLWMREGVDREALAVQLIQASLMVGQQLGLSSIHWLFCTLEEQGWLKQAGFSPRDGIQFHWTRGEMDCFDRYLECMTRKRRKEVRRERSRANAHGLSLRVLTGAEMTGRDWRALYDFYLRTIRHKGAIPYLSEGFFKEIQTHFAGRVVCSMAYRGEEPVAGTLNFRRGTHLYGRYWGCLEDLDSLHFELCYYQLIDWSFKQGIERFEAGAQGFHKLARGFLPSRVHSAHYLFHEGLRAAVDEFLEYECKEVNAKLDALHAHSPFRDTPPKRSSEPSL
jgi:uncharacterized protein